MQKFVSALAFLAILWPAAVVAAEEPAARAARPAYKVGIEDELRIVTWDEPALSLNVKVRPDGKITVPLVNDVDVVGKTTDQIRSEIARRLADFIREPSVTVLVTQINSFRVYFLGEVNAPGAIQFYQPTRLLQAIATAGGLTPFAKKQITVIREIGGVEKRIPIDYKRLVSGDLGQENIFLAPGDMLLFH
ncbi:MAG: polysaccharide export protein [bacterium]|nr:polysaccharide export protein [bacterium]